MLRLNIGAEPYWLDLGHDVSVKVSPLTTAIMMAARNDAAVRELPEDATNEQRSVAFSKAVARIAVSEWKGVGDADGNPVEPSPEGIDALIEFYPMYEAFQLHYVAKGMALELEKNASAPLPNGISAAGANTAPTATADAPSALNS